MHKIFDAPFMLCVKFLQWLGRTFNLTYQEISVVFNLWIQGGVLLATAFLPMLRYILKCDANLNSNYAISIMYALINTIGFAVMLWHYRLPMNKAFLVCVEDLKKIAAICHTTYNTVNIVIFVIIYLAMIAFNCIWEISV